MLPRNNVRRVGFALLPNRDLRLYSVASDDRRLQARHARHIFAIPSSSANIEQIFSGGRNVLGRSYSWRTLALV